MPRNFETDDNDQLEQTLEQESPSPQQLGQSEPAYKLVGESKIPVSKHHGKIWQGRKDAAKKARNKYEDSWNEALKYFLNDQSAHRNDRGENRSGNTSYARQMNEEWTETENVVFANTTSLLPALYAKNPQTEFTAANRENEQVATIFERLIDTLMWMKTAPGVNLKPKARQGVLTALLTNMAWMEIGWTFKDSSSEQAINDIVELSQKLQNAEDQDEIHAIEGKLMAIEKHLDILEPEGPFCRHHMPHNVVIDPETEEPDLSDMKWMGKCMYLPTEYLNARYGEKDKSGNIVSVYKPTHVLKANAGGTGSSDAVEQEVNNFSLFEDGGEAKQYGYDDDESFKSAQRTLVWVFWDKTTRRVYMFADNRWDWPLWVWDDPYHLQAFFPFYPLGFYDNPSGPYGKGEVTYYLDQQDAINEINDEERRARLWVKRNILFDSNSVAREEVENFLKGPDGTARGVDLPEGKRMQDVIFTMPPPSLKFPELFNVDRKLQAIDRISSVSDIMRGVQFKANTTNDAVETYNSVNQMRLDEKIDKIEDWIGDIAWGLAQLTAQFMDEGTVRDIVGDEVLGQEGWRKLTPEELRTTLTMRVVGGSTAKPTSRAKKQEAIEAGQVMSQFTNSAPAIVEVILRMFEQAFDEIVVKDEDWEMIRQSMFQSQNRAGAGPGAAQEGGQAANGSGEMPPEAEQAIQTLVQQGVPEQQAREAVMQRLQGGGQQTPQTQQ
jgi:hypothetical protein